MYFSGPIYIHTFGDVAKCTLDERRSMRKHCGPYQWTPQNRTRATATNGRGFYATGTDRSPECGDSTFALRLSLANEYLTHARLGDIRGYYTSGTYDEMVKPIIALLPHGRGFLAGYTYGVGMCSGINLDIYATGEEAARAAHVVAEEQAERAREAEAEYAELQEIEE